MPRPLKRAEAATFPSPARLEPEMSGAGQGGAGMNNPTGDTPSRIHPVPDFYALTASAADMTTVTTTDGLYRYVSPASKRMFGWDPLQLQGHHQDEFVHSDDLPSVHAASRLPGSVITLTYRFRCGDGSYRWIEATSRQVREAGATYRVATVRDIAERQKSDL
jgi:PAS domain S-box-containing protein